MKTLRVIPLIWRRPSRPHGLRRNAAAPADAGGRIEEFEAPARIVIEFGGEERTNRKHGRDHIPMGSAPPSKGDFAYAGPHRTDALNLR